MLLTYAIHGLLVDVLRQERLVAHLPDLKNILVAMTYMSYC